MNVKRLTERPVVVRMLDFFDVELVLVERPPGKKATEEEERMVPTEGGRDRAKAYAVV